MTTNTTTAQPVTFRFRNHQIDAPRDADGWTTDLATAIDGPYVVTAHYGRVHRDYVMARDMAAVLALRD